MGTGIRNCSYRFEIVLEGKPIDPPNTNLAPITNSPAATLINDLNRRINSPPSITWIATYVGF